MARSLEVIKSDIEKQKKLYECYKDWEMALINLYNKLGFYGWNSLYSAFNDIKEGYVDDDNNYIGFSLMDDIISDGGRYHTELTYKVSALINKSTSQRNACYNNICNLQNEYSVAYRDFLKNNVKRKNG